MKRLLKVLGWVVGVVLAVILVMLLYVQAVWDRPDKRPAPTMAARHDSATIARGEYIFNVTWQCGGCHTGEPGKPEAPPSGGQVFDLRDIGPGFGVYYSRNITPDSATGVGAWTDGEIVQAIREGVRRDRRVLFPLMPIDWLNGISDEDALAIVAYIRSLPPVRKEIPPAEVSMMAKALFAFNVLAPKPPLVTAQAAPPRGVTVEFGKYFATHMSGCADCHTPRNLNNGQFYFDSVFAGGSFEFGGPEGHPLRSYASNLRAVLGNGSDRWSEEDFVGAVTSGMRPDGTVLDPHMPYSAFKRLDAEDIQAMYLFFGSLERIPRVVPHSRYVSGVLAARGSDRGKLLFEARCAPCHGAEGKGAAPTQVKLAEVSASINDVDLQDFIEKGQPNLKMPSFGKTLSSEEAQDLVAFIRSWERH